MKVYYDESSKRLIVDNEVEKVSKFSQSAGMIAWGDSDGAITVSIKTALGVCLEPILFSLVKKENGDAYTTEEELEIAIKDFFVNASLGEAISDDHIFADNTARDAYFTANLDELKSALNIIVGGVLQVWTDGTSPATYDNAKWLDYSAPLTGAQVLSLFLSNADTEVLTTTKKAILDKLTTDVNGNTVSSNAWIFPPSTIYIGLSAALSNALRALNLYDGILNKRGLMLAQIYDDSGSQKAFVYDIAPVSNVVANAGTGLTEDVAMFSRTPLNDEVIRAFTVSTSTPNTAVNTEIIIRLVSPTGAKVYSVKKTVTTDGNGDAWIELTSPIVTDAGLELFMEYRVAGMIGSLVGSDFVPKHIAKVQLLSRKPIATEEWVAERFGKMAAGYYKPQINTSCPTTSQFYKVDIPFVAEKENGFVFDVINKRWVYQDSYTKDVSIMATWTGAHDDDNPKGVTWTFLVNGVETVYSPKFARIERDDPMSMSLLIPSVEINTGDYIEMFVSIDDPYDIAYTSNINILIR